LNGSREGEFGRGGERMVAPGVAEARTLLRRLRFIDPTWCGTALVPCWGSELEIHLKPEEDDITPRQLHVVRALLSRADDIRREFERALFAYYKADVDGSYCSYGAAGLPIPGSGPPKLTEPSQVWSLIDGPEIYIKPYLRTPSAVEFELSFTCEWDPEHGLGVLYQNWEPVEFGGWDL
jgi:hypothetical protein